ncbi:hypothetical protein [Nostoc sp. CHAB 5715]|uniref:hypothetical protein n=1 Tax=Nostoc sp. CHAB 5715 TaxID=2780400 RepID=UPI001E5D9A02|nr:hypothetical protein [Nostoc sp. CHAB 5715]MCC5622160.1 hypothetical protein [Nostoc sp. CHAB 5715]
MMGYVLIHTYVSELAVRSLYIGFQLQFQLLLDNSLLPTLLFCPNFFPARQSFQLFLGTCNL